MPQRHDAFISYSHENDAALAAALETGLERLAKPIFRLRAIDVFRDKSSLAAAPGLWSGIQDHLTASKGFLLMASPASAASSWCNKEIAWWLEHQGATTVLIVLTEGEIVWDAHAADFDWSRTTALSAALRGRFSEEPLYVDLRWARDDTRSTSGDARFRDAILDLAAPIRSVPKDQLDGEDVRQLRRTKRLARAGVTTIAIVAAVAIWQAIEATRQRRVAEQQRDTALSRQLAAQASELRVQQPRLSLLLAAQALASSRTAEASTALLRALNAAPFARMVERPETFWSLAVSDDEEWAVIGDGDGGVQRVRLATGEVARLVRDDVTSANQGALGKPTLAVAVSPDGASMASGGIDQAITLWKGDRAFHTIAGRHEGFILGLAFSPDGRWLASAGSDGRVFLNDLVSDTATKLKDGWMPEASAVRFSPDGRVVAAGGDKGFRDLYQARDGSPFRRETRRDSTTDPLPAPTTSVIALSFSSDGTELFAGFSEGVIGIYDVRAGGMKGRAQTGAHGLLNAMAVAPDGRRVFTGHSDGSVILWERPRATYEGWKDEVLYRHSGEVRGIAFLPRSRQLVTVGFDGRLFMSLPSFTPPLTRERWSDAQPFRAASLNAQRDRVTLSMTDRSVVVDAASGTVVATNGPAPSPSDATPKIQPIAVHPECSAFKDANGSLFVRSGDRQVEVSGYGNASIVAACFSPDRRVLYTLLVNGTLSALGPGRGAVRRKLARHSSRSSRSAPTAS
jgi:WD40 repeat protein